MPGPIPTPIGGVSEFFDGDDIGAEERQIRRSFGIGVYSENVDSDHGRKRLVLAAALAWEDANDWALWLNGIPDRAVDLLPEWEEILGLGPAPASWGLDERWNRIRARCTEFRGSNPTVLEAAFSLLCGAACYCSETDGYPLRDERNGAYIAMILPQSAWDDQLMWRECERMRDRMEPAHCRIALCVTNVGIGGPGERPTFWSTDTDSDPAASLSDRDCSYPD